MKFAPSAAGADGATIDLPYVFAMRVLPIVIFMSSVFGVLQHWGWLRWLVDLFARVLRRLLATSLRSL